MTAPLISGNVEPAGTAPRASVPPASEIGFEYSGTPGWGYFGGGMLGAAADDVPQLLWPTNVNVYHLMRTDAQIDALIKSVTFPLRRLHWTIKPNGAKDEVVEDFSNMFGLPIQGNNDDFVIKGRPTFDHDDHLRMALLSPTVYGHMAFEYVGEIMADLKWLMTNLAPRMPQTIAQFNVARNGDLVSIKQHDPRKYQAPPIPASQLAMYTWDLEGGNWAGRSMLRPLYKHWVLKDRLLRIDAIKNERFGAGIPKGTAPTGGDPADYQKLASSMRAAENGGVGVPAGGDVSIEGVRGTLPDTLGSIRYQDEAMARSFLAMFMQLGQTETGSRALGESFVDFFQDALWGFAKWYIGTTNQIFYRITDWNYGEDEPSPLIAAEEREDRKLNATDLANLSKSGALVLDAELQNWIRKEYDMPEYTGGEPLPTKPATEQQDSSTVTVNAGGKPSKGTPADKRLKKNKAKISIKGSDVAAHADHDQTTHGNRKPKDTKQATIHVMSSGNVRVVHPKASSQTVNSTTVGHRQPSDVEVAAATDFNKLQADWEKVTTTLVDGWSDIRDQQIEALLADIKVAVNNGDTTALASLEAPVLGADLILKHMKELATVAITDALAEAKSQGKTLEKVAVADLEPELTTRSEAIATLMANGISQSASTQALLRYGVDNVSADGVAEGVGAQLDSLSDSYLNDVLGGALTQAQNTGRRSVMEQDGSAAIYSSELMDQNTCEECAGVDGTQYGSMTDASADYPAGGYVDCAGGPRCRGTLVAVYGEGDAQ